MKCDGDKSTNKWIEITEETWFSEAEARPRVPEVHRRACSGDEKRFHRDSTTLQRLNIHPYIAIPLHPLQSPRPRHPQQTISQTV